DRSFMIRQNGDHTVTGQAVLQDRTAIERLGALPGEPMTVSASSTAVEHGAAGARWAFADDPRSIWFADPLDTRPTPTVKPDRATTLTPLPLTTTASHLGAPALHVTIRAERG